MRESPKAVTTFLLSDPTAIFETLVAAGLAAGFYRYGRQRFRAEPTRRAVRLDPVVAVFDDVHVEHLGKEWWSRSTLRSPGTRNRVSVHTHTFDVSFNVFVGAACTAERSEQSFGVLRPRWRDCLLVHGAFGGEAVTLAMYSEGSQDDLQRALQKAGVRGSA